MRVTETRLPGVRLIDVRAFPDERGFFAETYNARRYAEAGIDDVFVQDNLSLSHANVLRGMHFQEPHGQAKLVGVLSGEVFDACVDVRVGSPTFGQWFGTTLSAENGRQLYVPSGFAHGFLVTGDHAIFSYKTSEYYDPAAERSIAWNDPAVGIEWPKVTPILNAKDAVAPSLAALVASGLAPAYGRHG